jgi:hypothetical protein
MKKLMTNVFTCCNGKYNDFIPLFILSNLYHNDNVFVEVGTDEYSEISNTNSIKLLNKLYPNRFKLRYSNFNNYLIGNTQYPVSPNTVRFIETPEIKTEYVYISDVDIICLTKNFSQVHIDYMKEFNQPYSNMVRNGKDSLTGLHFTPYNNHYPLSDFGDLLINDSNLLSYDEKFLYLLVNKNYPIEINNNNFRPVHGIHVSLNRDPYGDVGWGVNRDRYLRWVEFRNSDEFLTLEPSFSKKIKETINIIDNYKI